MTDIVCTECQRATWSCACRKPVPIVTVITPDGECPNCEEPIDECECDNCPSCEMPADDCTCEAEDQGRFNIDEYLDDPRHGQADEINRKGRT